MTTQEMIQEVFETLAEPTDLEVNTTPGDATTFDITLPGAQRILRALNQAMVRISNWKYRDGRLLRFRSLYDSFLWKYPGSVAKTVTSATAGTVTIPGFAVDADDSLNGWVIEVAAGLGQGQKRIVIDTVVSAGDLVLSVDYDFDTTLDATSEVALYKNFVQFVDPAGTATYLDYHVKIHPNVSMADVLRIRNLKDQADLGRAYLGESYTAGMMNTGTPTEFALYGNKIVFDSALDSAQSYELLYYRNPVALSQAAQVPEISAPFHEAATLYAIHKLQLRSQDYEGQYVMKKNLVDLMEDMRLDGAFSYEMDQMSIVVWG